MSKYHKINSPFKRDKKTNKIILGDWAVPEFNLLKNIKWTCREKIDGTNIRVIWNGESPVFKGRTDNALIPSHLATYLKETFTKELLSSVFSGQEEVVLYGEGYGYKIQKGSKYFEGKKDVGFILFDIKIGNWYLTEESLDIISKNLNIKKVPIVYEGTLIESMEIISNGLKSRFGDFYAEGVVCTPQLQLFCRNGSRVITKLKHKDLYGKTLEKL